MAGRIVLAIALLAAGRASAASSSAELCETMPMVDNFREIQPANTVSPDTRTLWRTSGATSTCNAAVAPSTTSGPNLPSNTKYKKDKTDASHWTYADQENWNLYGSASECFAANMVGTYPGESPINIVATDAAVPPTGDPTITITGANRVRKGLPIFNNGHTVGYSVCANSFDCGINANFGAWPRQMRGMTDNLMNDYYLLQMHWHWGSDSTKGSEHQVCGNTRAAELHLVWVNKHNVTANRNDPESGLLLAVTGIMVEGGATEDNQAFASMIDNIGKKVPNPGNGATGVEIRVDELFPVDWQTKFYTYPGSLTTP
eukprot:CAMPEP_0172581528 /NCGR_PEP_ID=MMETSP1068-20121228/739_1 /TAXON_ID=35684 /ORGANISM="Pseudopedinella elastica, Strain CCMP716" /LENGTH=315 /DNA_ID=CAMNT_0013374531 /DNA_START=82 /DNA_END=1026 /DNA_ORIENTATION=+